MREACRKEVGNGSSAVTGLPFVSPLANRKGLQASEKEHHGRDHKRALFPALIVTRSQGQTLLRPP